MPSVRGVYVPIAGSLAAGGIWPYKRYNLDGRRRVDHKDLDETRRLLYMVLYGGLDADRWFNLAGTLTNALAHHSGLADADEVMARFTALRDGNSEHEQWVRGLIDQIGDMLNTATD